MGLAGIAVGVVAGVYTHFLDDGGCRFGSQGVEVDVCHQGDVAAAFGEFVLDVVKILGGFDVGSRDADNLAASFHQTEGLIDGGLGVHRVGIGHGLHPDGGTPSEREVTYLYLTTDIHIN